MSADRPIEACVASVRNLVVAYGEGAGAKTALGGIDLDIARGERVGIVGESGSGKSTLAHALAALLGREARMQGSIRILGREIRGASEDELRGLRGRSVGVVFQDSKSALHPLLRVEDQVAEAWTAHAREREGRARVLARQALAGVGLDPARHGRAFPHQLSGGMRQRVQIATALALDPALLVLDEPTTALDTVTQKRIFDDLEGLRRARGFALLLVTHDLALARDRCDRIVRLEDGRVVEVVHSRDVIVPKPVLRRKSVGAATAESVLCARSVSVGYAAPGRWFRRGAFTRIVEDVSLDLDGGATVALVGNSGSGKTSLVRGLLRLVEPSSGSVRFRPAAGAEPVEILRLEGRALRGVRPDLAVVFQDPATSLDPRERARDVLVEALSTRHLDRHDERVRALFEECGLDAEHLGRFPHQLSGGEAQRLCIARALATEPRVLVLDEALASLDTQHRERILALLARRRDAGLAILLVTHDLGSVEGLADRVYVMAHGRIVEGGATERLFATPGHAETRALLEARPGR